MIFGTLQLLQPLLGRLMYLLSSMVEVDPSMSFFGTHDVSVVDTTWLRLGNSLCHSFGLFGVALNIDVCHLFLETSSYEKNKQRFPSSVVSSLGNFWGSIGWRPHYRVWCYGAAEVANGHAICHDDAAAPPGGEVVTCTGKMSGNFCDPYT